MTRKCFPAALRRLADTDLMGLVGLSSHNKGSCLWLGSITWHSPQVGKVLMISASIHSLPSVALGGLRPKMTIM